MAGTPDDSQRRLVLLAEYNTVYQEIGRRSDAQQPLIALSITALAGITSLVMYQSAARPAVLLIPLVAGTCGLLWLDHAFTIRNKGKYIGGELRPGIVDGLDKPDELLRNEVLTRKQELITWARLLSMTSMLFFAIASLASVALGLDFLTQPDAIRFADDWLNAMSWAGWGAGLGLTVAYVIGAVIYTIAPVLEERRLAAAEPPSGDG